MRLLRKGKRLPKEQIVKFVSVYNGWTWYNTGWVWPSRWKKELTREDFRKCRDNCIDEPLSYTIHLYNRQVLKPNKEYNLIIDYPLSTPFEKKIKTRSNGMDLLDLINLCVKSYKQIYEEEAKTSTLKEETIKQRSKGKSMLINRAQTNGKYGIWGHVLGDLTITEIGIKGNKIRLHVDS